MAFYVLRRGVELSSIIVMAIAYYYYGTIGGATCVCRKYENTILVLQSNERTPEYLEAVGVLGVQSGVHRSTFVGLWST
jgi:hypothetical protein